MHWYVRQNNRVSGPFPSGQISQSLLLGRLTPEDLISKDREEWHPIAEFPDLIPEVLQQDPHDEQAQQRLAAARRWADERRQERRDAAAQERLVAGRREGEAYETLEYRQNREQNVQYLKQGGPRHWGGLVFVLIILTAGSYIGFRYIPQSPAASDCAAPPAPGVDWSYCNMAGLQSIKAELAGANLNSTYLVGANLFGGDFAKARLPYANLAQANLSFADLHGAVLKGANLRGADLSKADLSGADLSYANLRNAKLQQAQLQNARLDHAIWLDGRQCLVNSLGSCNSPQ
jgi:hypothetical protein